MTCPTKGCSNKTRWNTPCSTCRTRKQRKNSPFKYYYGKLKHRAKERGKPFNLTLEQFMLLWLCEPDKWKEKISDGECRWQMDRINNNRGYEFDNIQIIKKHRNIEKYIKHDRFHMDVRWVPWPERPTNDEVPF